MTASVANLRPNRAGEPGPALRHGAWSAIRLAPRAEEIATEIREIVPAYTEADEPTVRLAAIVLAQVEAGYAYVAEHGLVDGKGQPRPILRHLGTTLNTASRLMRDLGCTPTSRASMGLDLVRAQAEVARDGMRSRYLDPSS